MTSRLYRAQTIPEPDAYGRLVLKEAKTNIFGMALIMFSICAIALISAAYWYLLLYSGTLPAGLAVFQIKLGAGLGTALPLALPYCIKWLKNPPSLVVDDEGIELREPGRTQRMAWQDVREIRTDVIRDTTITANHTGTFDPHTVTVIRGQADGIVLNADFGVTATALTAYLIQRQNGASGPGAKLADMNAAAVQKVETRGRRLNYFQLVLFLIVLVGVIAFLLFLLWARMTLF